MVRIRTIQGAFEEIRNDDPDTAVTAYRIRQLVINGEVPSRKVGSKFLVDLDALQTYFTAGAGGA